MKNFWFNDALKKYKAARALEGHTGGGDGDEDSDEESEPGSDEDEEGHEDDSEDNEDDGASVQDEDKPDRGMSQSLHSGLPLMLCKGLYLIYPMKHCSGRAVSSAVEC